MVSLLQDLLVLHIAKLSKTNDVAKQTIEFWKHVRALDPEAFNWPEFVMALARYSCGGGEKYSLTLCIEGL